MSMRALLRSKKPSSESSDGKYSAMRSLVPHGVIVDSRDASTPILVRLGTEKAWANLARLDRDTAMMADVTKIESCRRVRNIIVRLLSFVLLLLVVLMILLQAIAMHRAEVVVVEEIVGVSRRADHQSERETSRTLSVVGKLLCWRRKNFNFRNMF
jgi:hypothetical protein